jgi:hypothetical protein
VTPYNHTRTQQLFGTPSQRVQLNPVAGPAFWLVSRPGGQITQTEQDVFRAALAYGRTRLDRAYAVISMRIAGTPPGAGIVPANFGTVLEYCFRPGAVAATITATLTTVRDNLNRVKTGLWTSDLQIVDSNPNRGGAASGYVRCSYSELFRTADAGRERSAGGRIHIRFTTYNAANSLANQQNCGITTVHEAAHKFCGCRDWHYIAEGVGAHLALIAMNLAPPLPAMTNQEALNNADSYAAFVANI